MYSACVTRGDGERDRRRRRVPVAPVLHGGKWNVVPRSRGISSVSEQVPARAYQPVVVECHDGRNEVTPARVQHRRADHREEVVDVDDVGFEGPEHPCRSRAPHSGSRRPGPG